MFKLHNMSFAEIDALCKKYCFDSTTWNFTVCTEVDFVDCALYPKRILELEYLVPVTVLLVLIFMSGFLGNLSVCTVILRHPNMRTETNAYLFSLAVSDILLLVFGLAPELQAYWQSHPYVFGEFFCRLSGFLAATATWASALTVVAFSIERYAAICHHTRSRIRGNRRVAMAIGAIWSVSVALAIPVIHVYHVVISGKLKYPPDSETSPVSLLGQVCMKPDAPEYEYYDSLYWITSVVFFFVPMAILMLMYIKIALFIRTNRKLARESGITNNCSENTKVFKLLVAVVLAFILCNAPFHYQRLEASAYLRRNSTTTQQEYDETTILEMQERNRRVLVITALFYYFSATINPILYNAMSKRYRTAFKEILTIGAKKKEYVEINKAPESIKTSVKTTSSTPFTANTTF